MSLFERKRIQEPKQNTSQRINFCGKYIRFKSYWNFSKSYKTANRGNITEFTHSSRMRILKVFAQVDFEKIRNAIFVTLTYPDECVELEYKKRTNQRSQFFREVEKYLGRKIPIVWRVEWVERKSGQKEGQVVPHIHLLILGVRFLPWQLIRKWWKRIIGWEGYVRTDVRKASSPRECAKYVAKYLAKAPDSSSLVEKLHISTTGRFWSITRRKLVPQYPQMGTENLSEEQEAIARAIIGHYCSWWNCELGPTVSLLGDKAEALKRELQENGIAFLPVARLKYRE